MIQAYLLRHQKPLAWRSPNAFAVLEFHDPASGSEPISFQLTFGQLRRLSEALRRLVRTGEQPDLVTPTPKRLRKGRPDDS